MKCLRLIIPIIAIIMATNSVNAAVDTSYKCYSKPTWNNGNNQSTWNNGWNQSGWGKGNNQQNWWTQKQEVIFAKVSKISSDEISFCKEKITQSKEKKNNTYNVQSWWNSYSSWQCNGTYGSFEMPSWEMTWEETEQTLDLSDYLMVAKVDGMNWKCYLSYKDINIGDEVVLLIDKSHNKNGIVTAITVTTSNKEVNNNQNDTAYYLLNGVTERKKNESYSATKANQSAVKVINGGQGVIEDTTITKSGETKDEGESTISGLNAAVLVTKSSSLVLEDVEITTQDDGAAAVFATGKNSKVTLEGVDIMTKGDYASGMRATSNGQIVAEEVNVVTKGEESPAVSAVKTEGAMTLKDCHLETQDEGSPCLYGVGTITMKNVTGIADDAEVVIIDGKSNINLTNCSLESHAQAGVKIYTNNDNSAVSGTSNLKIKGGNLEAKEGPLFNVINNLAVIALEDVELKYNDELLKVTTDKWGNGAHVTLTAKEQDLEGDIIVDSKSKAGIIFADDTFFKGSINEEDTAKSISVQLDQTSKWELTGDAYLNVLIDEDASLDNIEDNGYDIYYNSSHKSNAWLKGKTIMMQDGGKLRPI